MLRSTLKCLLVLLLSQASAALVSAERPNILIVITDDQGYGDLSYHGNPQLKTPHIDALAAASFRFERFFVSPLCAPTRASLLTGRYSLRTGVNGVSAGEEAMRSDEVTLAEVLRDHGYRTGLFGKWHNGEHYPLTPAGQGFDEVFGYCLGHWNNYFNTVLEHNGQTVETSGYIVDATTDAALKFIDADAQKPFLCWLAYTTPHSPFQVPEAYFDRYKALGLDDRMACIYGMCANLDDNVGRVLKHLESRNRRNNTLVIFLTDNGPNGARYNAGMRGTKGSLHEGGSRVPFFLSWPARFPQTRPIPQLAAHIDVLPTLVDLCGLTPPATKPLDGRSLAPLLENTQAPWSDRILVQQHQRPQNGAWKVALRSQTQRCVHEGKAWELYDMEKDPGQKKNIAAEFPADVERFKNYYEAYAKSIAAELRVEPLPIAVGATGPGAPRHVILTVPQSRFSGGLRFSGKHANNAWLIDWKNSGALVEWDVQVVQAGAYDVELQYLCPANSAGSRVRVSAGAAATDATITATEIEQVPSPDRVPREEVYEMKWATLHAGTLELATGRQALKIQALELKGEEALRLKSVRLSRK